MAFKFKFTSLMKYRKRIEEDAQREYLLARRNLDDCLLLIQQYYESMEKARRDISAFQVSGQAGALSQILSLEQFIEGQKVRVTNERVRAREFMAKVEEKQEILIEATREHKKIEKLEERMREDYRKEQKRLEAKRMDDLVVIRSRRRATV